MKQHFIYWLISLVIFFCATTLLGSSMPFKVGAIMLTFIAGVLFREGLQALREGSDE